MITMTRNVTVNLKISPAMADYLNTLRAGEGHSSFQQTVGSILEAVRRDDLAAAELADAK